MKQENIHFHCILLVSMHSIFHLQFDQLLSKVRNKKKEQSFFFIVFVFILGSSTLQDCTSCPPGKFFWVLNCVGILKDNNIFLGTYAADSGSDTCTPCPENTYSSDKGSTRCSRCGSSTQYSGNKLLKNLFYLSNIKLDEGSANCIERPVCGPEHYRKVFTGCDVSDTVNSLFFW